MPVIIAARCGVCGAQWPGADRDIALDVRSRAFFGRLGLDDPGVRKQGAVRSGGSADIAGWQAATAQGRPPLAAPG